VAYRDFAYKGTPADIVDNAVVVVEYDNGIRANFDLCMFSPMFFEELVVCGEGGRLRAFEQEDFRAGHGLRMGLELHRGEMHPAYTSEPSYPGIAQTLGHGGADFFATNVFVNLLAGDASNAPTVEEGYWSVVIGTAAEESIRRGDPVDILEFIAQQNAEIHDVC